MSIGICVCPAPTPSSLLSNCPGACVRVYRRRVFRPSRVELVLILPRASIALKFLVFSPYKLPIMPSFIVDNDGDSYPSPRATPDPEMPSRISRGARAGLPSSQGQLSSPQSSRMSSPEAQFARLSLQDSPSANREPGGPYRAVGSNLDTGPYNIDDEKPPEHAFFTDAFQTALKNGLGIAKEIADTIQNLPDSVERSPEVQALLDKAESLTKFTRSDTRTIAVLGDSGEGS